MNTMIRPIMIALVALAASLEFAPAATLIDFTMAEHTAANNTSVVLSSTSTLASGISSPSAKASPSAGFTTGGGGTADGEINWASWTSTSFFVVEFTVDSGSSLNLSNLTMDVSRNGGGAPTDFYAVVLSGTGLSGATLEAGTHLDLKTPAISGGSGGSVGQTYSWNLSSIGSLGPGSYTIGWGSESPTTGNMRISDIVVNGTIIPEPSSTALFGLAGMILLLRRRRN